jgi:four helix bundle protein
MTERELNDRTKTFALRGSKPSGTLPASRSGKSVGANGRAARRSRTAAEMDFPWSMGAREANESAFGTELVGDHGLMPAAKLDALSREAGELTAIMVASRQALQAGNRKSRIQHRK